MDYTAFHSIFLEMPQRINGGNPYIALLHALTTTLEYGESVIALGNDVYRAGDYFWVGTETAHVAQLIVGTTTIGRMLKVTAVGKDPEYTGRPPYAIDLYLTIANSLQHGVKFSSDQILSDSGFGVWSRIFSASHKLLVYANSSGKYKPDVLATPEDLAQYFSDADSSLDYQYVIAESAVAGALLGSFQLLEWKRLAGYPLQKLFGELYT